MYIQRIIFVGPHDIVKAYDPDLIIPGIYVPTLVVTFCAFREFNDYKSLDDKSLKFKNK